MCGNNENKMFIYKSQFKFLSANTAARRRKTLDTNKKEDRNFRNKVSQESAKKTDTNSAVEGKLVNKIENYTYLGHLVRIKEYKQIE